MSKDQDKTIREYLAEIGRKGGETRAAKYDKETLRKWAKKGGRPKKNSKQNKEKK